MANSVLFDWFDCPKQEIRSTKMSHKSFDLITMPKDRIESLLGSRIINFL